MLIPFSATVFSLNVATVVTFVTLRLTPALQLLLQRMTQVLTVVMISHMFPNLKGGTRHDSKDSELYGAPWSFGTRRPEPYERETSLFTRIKRPKKLSILVGNLGNELMHTSILDFWIVDGKKVGQNHSDLLIYPDLLYSYSPPLPWNFNHDRAHKY